MSGFRASAGGEIDRSRSLDFTFDGRKFTGHPGDTLASALVAAGVRILGRSFKYHRPRGLWSSWVDDPNAIMDVTLSGLALPNCPAATTPLAAGMAARAVNAWPSARADIKGGLDIFHRFLGAGFYYKTFMWPHWHLYEPLIRRMAGLGRAQGPVPESYAGDPVHDRCDLLVVGGGAAGLVAARAAAEAGQDVLLVEDHAAPGGGLFARGGTVEGRPVAEWIATQGEAIRAAGGRILTRTTAIGVYDHRLVALAEDRGFALPPRLIRLRVGRMILATGALDRPLTFAGNDKPGIMSLAGAQDMLGRYGLVPGREIVILSGTDSAAAARFRAAGARVTELDPGAGPIRATGWKTLAALTVGDRSHPCDMALVSGGVTPTVHLWRHAGGGLDWAPDIAAFVPGTGPGWLRAVGAANGTLDLSRAMEEARAAGLSDAAPARPAQPAPAPPPAPRGGGRQWIDFQHDVTLSDVQLAARENYASVEHLKRYTTLGMAMDQGKTANMPALAAMAGLREKPIPEIGTTTFRPPYTPLVMAAYKGAATGQSWRPLKRLPLEPQHRAAGAAMGEYGGWLRPGWYGQDAPGAVAAQEAAMARQAAGVFDGSPLGKIEVIGPDAADFVNFICYNTMTTLKPGAIRYTFLLTEAGVIHDDGVVARLAPDRFLISCSSSHVASVNAWTEAWRQDGNDPDRIFIHDTTQNLATVTLTGPGAREIAAALDMGADMGAAAFPHMTFRTGSFEGHPLRISRVSFTGDPSFEITCPLAVAPALWDAAIAAARARGGGPLGVEALAILRAEKGYVMVGKDTDGETMPHDLGFDGPRGRRKTAFLGDRGLHSPAARDPDRRQLVGLRVPDGAPALPTGAHLVAHEGARPVSLGFVTSSYHSPALDQPIALALLRGGRAMSGQNVTVWHLGETCTAQVVSPVFLDPRGVRLHA